MPMKIIASDVSAGAIIDSSTGDGTLTLQTGPAGAKVDAISLAADGTPTFLKVPKNTAVQSMIRLHTANGNGSGSTVIRRFLTVVTNQGSDITYTTSADTSVLGSVFTINTNGVYTISYTDAFSTQTRLGLSLNSSQLTTAISSVTTANKLCAQQSPSANNEATISWTGYLVAGDVIRPHSDGGANAASLPLTQFTITRVA